MFINTDCSIRTFLSVEQAISVLCECTYCSLRVESVPIITSLGRVLARDVVTSIPLPLYNHSAVDGYGIHVTNKTEELLPLIRNINRAGSLQFDQAVYLSTGTTLPAGVNAVVMQEHCLTDGNCIKITKNVTPGTNCRFSGEDIQTGRLAMTAGTRLRPQELGFAVAIGLTDLPVYVNPKVALFSTGDELHGSECKLSPMTSGYYTYDINRYSLFGILTAMGCTVTDFGILPDRINTVTAALEHASSHHDLIVTSGGVSVGKKDYVRTAISIIGSVEFWGIRIKPGKPLVFGTIGNTPILGLPGNPAAAIICLLIVGRPLVLTLAGRSSVLVQSYPVSAGFCLTRSPGRREFLRVKLSNTMSKVSAILLPKQGSAMLSSMVHADGLVDLSETVSHVEQGETVFFLPFTDLLW